MRLRPTWSEELARLPELSSSRGGLDGVAAHEHPLRRLESLLVVKEVGDAGAPAVVGLDAGREAAGPDLGAGGDDLGQVADVDRWTWRNRWP